MQTTKPGGSQGKAKVPNHQDEFHYPDTFEVVNVSSSII